MVTTFGKSLQHGGTAQLRAWSPPCTPRVSPLACPAPPSLICSRESINDDDDVSANFFWSFFFDRAATAPDAVCLLLNQIFGTVRFTRFGTMQTTTDDCAICLDRLQKPGAAQWIAECGHQFHFRSDVWVEPPAYLSHDCVGTATCRLLPFRFPFTCFCSLVQVHRDKCARWEYHLSAVSGRVDDPSPFPDPVQGRRGEGDELDCFLGRRARPPSPSAD